MKEVMTVLGPISSEELGFTSMHEHILLDMREWREILAPLVPDDLATLRYEPVNPETIGLLKRNWFLLEDNLILDDENMMTAEVADFKAAGGAAMVDMSCLGLRSDLLGIQRISRRTGVHVVVTTGLYVEGSWPEHIRDMTVDELTDLMVGEIEEGIGDTGIRAGHIGEIGMDRLSDSDVKLLRAAARASIRTGLSVSVHQTIGESCGHRIVDILIQEGTNPTRVVMCHMDGYVVSRNLRWLLDNRERWGLNLDYVRSILDRGVNVSFDCWGHQYDIELEGLVVIADWQRIAGLLELINRDYVSQIVLANDICMKMLLRRYGGEGYSSLPGHLVPMLKTLGVCDYDIRQMTIDNPACLLAR
jgi:phosphotriesterase-related protein